MPVFSACERGPQNAISVRLLDESFRTVKPAKPFIEQGHPDLSGLVDICFSPPQEDVTHNSSKQDLYVAVRKHFNSMVRAAKPLTLLAA